MRKNCLPRRCIICGFDADHFIDTNFDRFRTANITRRLYAVGRLNDQRICPSRRITKCLTVCFGHISTALDGQHIFGRIQLP